MFTVDVKQQHNNNNSRAYWESQFACSWLETRGHIGLIRKTPTWKPLYLGIWNFSHLVTSTQLEMLKFQFDTFSSLGVTTTQKYNLHTVDFRYLEVEGNLWNTSRYPYFDISDLQNWGKYQNWTTKFHKWTCNLTPLVRNICWKYCGKGENLLLMGNFSSYPQYLLPDVRFLW